MKRLLTLLPVLLLFNITYGQLGGRWDFGGGSTTLNIPPTANAGLDKVITLPTNLTGLTSSSTDVDGTIAQYQWTQLTGAVVSITSPNSPTTQVGPFTIVASNYTFELRVIDNSGAIDRDTVSVTVNAAANILPVANAGPDKSITLPVNTTAVTGLGTDADGTIIGYNWIKVSGPSGGDIDNIVAANIIITNLVEGTYQYKMTVTDNSGGTAFDVMQVVVHPAIPPPNTAPTVDAGLNQVLVLPTNSTTITATGIDIDGTITYSWIKLTGPSGGTIVSPGSASTVINGLIQGIYEYRVTVTDDDGATATDVVQITVNDAINIPPVANAGPDITITAPVNTVTMAGGGTDVDGTVVAFQWTRISRARGTRSTINNPSDPNTIISGLLPGTYTFQLRVVDDDGAIGVDDMIITVNPAVGSFNGAYTFTLPSKQVTSAGVFAKDSLLVKTLWNLDTLPAGTYTKYWDGTNDIGQIITVPDATYKVKVLTSNIQSTWQGIMGNASNAQTGVTIHRGYYYCMKGLAFGPTYGYFCTGFSEGAPAFAKFNIATPNTKIQILGPTTSTCEVSFVATDGIKVYWGSADGNSPNNTFIFGTNVSDDAYVTFANGIPFTPSNRATINSVISYLNAPDRLITGLAVQRTGNYLFVARNKGNQVQVLNKTTGALVQTLTYTSPRGLSIDGSDNLWMCTGANTVAKYTVNSNGTLTAPVLTLSGLLDPQSTQVNAGGTLVAVADCNTSQQIKFFNNGSGTSGTTLGVAGGYATDASVNNNKFYFNDVNGFGTAQYTKQTFIAFQSDGSYWVNDPGNFRVQHYNSSNVFVDRVMSLGATYNVFADKNNINKIFAEFQEYSVDYSVQTLTGTAGWTLVKNWGYSMDQALYDGSFVNEMTLSNGRTYGIVRRRTTPHYEVVEFQASNTLRFTGVLLGLGVSPIICNDGSLQTSDDAAIMTFYRYPLTGFTSNNPVWSSTGQVIASGTKDNSIGNPVEVANSQIFSTTNNKVALFNHKTYVNNTTTASSGYHVGIMARGATNNNFLAQTEQSTHKSYVGAYPIAGWYDVGNGVNDYGGGAVCMVDSIILTNYHGEFWKNGQTNEFNLYYLNGLSLGQFGTTRHDVGHGAVAAAKMAGNVVTPILLKDAFGDLYLYHGDEGDHAGFHRWKITGLNTISQQETTMPYPINYVVPSIDYADLMINLPLDVSLPNNTAGWTRNPASDLNTSSSDYWRVATTRLSYKNGENDVTVEARVPTPGTRTVDRDLGVNNVASDWKIEGQFSFPSGHNRNIQASEAYLEVLDNTNKVLARFYMGTSGSNTAIFGNAAVIISSPDFTITGTENYLPFKIETTAAGMKFTYGYFTPVTTAIFDGTGNWKTPTTLRLRFTNNGAGGNSPQTISVKDFKFYKDIL